MLILRFFDDSGHGSGGRYRGDNDITGRDNLRENRLPGTLGGYSHRVWHFSAPQCDAPPLGCGKKRFFSNNI